MVTVRDTHQDLLGQIQAFGEAEIIIFDLTRVEVSASDLGLALGSLWPAVAPPVIFLARNETVLSAAILSYPGRPGVSGDPVLTATAGEMGALWLA